MLINKYYTIKQAQTILDLAIANGRGISITTSVNSEVDKFNNNVSEWISQTKEERENNAPRTYVGNGKVVFSKAKEYPIAPKQGKSDENPF